MLPSKIPDNELSETLVSRLPLRPAAQSKYRTSPMTGEAIREAFDRSAKLIAERLNQMIGFLTEASQSSGVANLPYTEGVTLGQTLEELAASLTETKEGLTKLKSDCYHEVSLLEVKTYSDLQKLERKMNKNTESLNDTIEALQKTLNETLEAALTETNEEMTKLKSDCYHEVSLLEVKTYSDLQKIERKINENVASLNKTIEALQKALNADVEKAQQRADEAYAIAESADEAAESLSESVEAMRTKLNEAHTLASNAVPASKTMGVYAYDYDSTTGGHLNRTIKFQPTVNEIESGQWQIAQRDFYGCLQAQPPRMPYQLTTKAYVEEHFHAKPQTVSRTVNGKKDILDWIKGSFVAFGNGGMPTEDSAMMHSTLLNGTFSPGEKAVFVCSSPGASVTDIYRGQHPLEYDASYGAYVLHYIQQEPMFEDDYECSCIVNAPIGASVYYENKNVQDTQPLQLDPALDYNLKGCGVKELTFKDSQNYRLAGGGEVNLHFASDNISVFFTAPLPVYCYGDCCANGVLEIKRGMYYNLAVSFDGYGYVCRVLAYPVANGSEVLAV